MKYKNDFGFLDKADIKLVINNTNQEPVWTGIGNELPPGELLADAKAVLLVIPEESTVDNLNLILKDILSKIPEDTFFLYTSADKKRMEIYVNKN